MEKLASLLHAYNIEPPFYAEPIGSGLIHKTWKVRTAATEYVLQQINHNVFTKPGDIEYNNNLLEGYLKQYHDNYLIVFPLADMKSKKLIRIDGFFYRLFPFVKDSHTIQCVETADQAYEAASQFGRFTSMFSGMQVKKLRITIPGFHDLRLRYRQFLTALKKGNAQRITFAKEPIQKLLHYSFIEEEYRFIQSHPDFKVRVTHHDTKISNVLFNDYNEGICVIDLDTVMPGYFISDLGDMMRTYLSAANEDETDFEKIIIRKEMYKAIKNGYLNEMKDELTKTETDSFYYSGKFIIYMQAIRFLTDYLKNDTYYGAQYENQNYDRAGNQIVLLEQYLNMEKILSR
ncbi:MAG: phosphotransferase enzyme family protein [Chitinophagaceae bacterium]